MTIIDFKKMDRIDFQALLIERFVSAMREHMRPYVEEDERRAIEGDGTTPTPLGVIRLRTKRRPQ